VHTMTFDRPVDVPVLVRLDATFVDVNLPIDDESIRQEIATKKFNIGINLKTNALYGLAFNSGETSFLPTLKSAGMRGLRGRAGFYWQR